MLDNLAEKVKQGENNSPADPVIDCNTEQSVTDILGLCGSNLKSLKRCAIK